MTTQAAGYAPKVITQGGAATTAIAGVWTWVGHNAEAIGVVAGIVGIAVGIYISRCGFRLNAESIKRREKAEQEHRDRMYALELRKVELETE